jgi:soluble lytic murein transglycosylase
MAWWVELRGNTGDWLYAHDAFRHYLWSHPFDALGDRQAQVIRLAWPDRYWDLVQEAAKGDRYDPRLFHALVREESNFNSRIESFAGALGLSQLMPATAKQTAGWLGMTVAISDLDDPKTNLTIGARYLDAMHKEQGGSPYLALASYNAGGGRSRQWTKAWGNPPTDEWVERIPFRETRGYVKRVMGTWQTMRWQFDVEEDGYYDLSAFNHAARPDQE